MSRKVIFWILWALGTLLAVAIIVVWMFLGGDRGMLVIGQSTDAHHQIMITCETCHAAPVFSDTATAERALNQTCRNCHEEELRAAGDSHSRKKFRGPRMAVYRERLDARRCTSCHVEHRPEITRAGAVTVAMDFCAACHSEGDQDVRKARPSHASLSFNTCASAGCHNYHDNRALYEDFLVRRATQPWVAPSPAHKLTARYRSRQLPEKAAIGRNDAIAPEVALADQTALNQWAASAHAAGGVNCAGCHAPDVAQGTPRAEVEARWVDAPDMRVCEGCHKMEANTFALGRHGMRRHPLIAPPRDTDRRLEALGLGSILPKGIAAWLADPVPPTLMTVAESRLPMRDDAVNGTLDCGTCHQPHAVDIKRAAVQACASCHDDTHTKAYFDSVHYGLWRAELAGEAPPGSGVSCATCHMVKFESRGKIMTNHNQNDNLRPNEKMIRSICLDCHGLGFAIDSLADAGLVARNYRGKPAVQVKSIEWAKRRAAVGERNDRR